LLPLLQCGGGVAVNLFCRHSKLYRVDPASGDSISRNQPREGTYATEFVEGDGSDPARTLWWLSVRDEARGSELEVDFGSAKTKQKIVTRRIVMVVLCLAAVL